MLEPQQRISHYEIRSHLGNGGMGNVYQAVQLPLERPVALKVIRHDASDEAALKRFEIEARAVSELDHNNIVALYDYGIENGMTYFAMQYVDGQDLFSIIKKNPRLPISLIVNFAKQIARGLRYAHKCGVVHRDIKPHNILVDRNKGICKITDFGIAQTGRTERITMVGMAIGTPEYMSPEQAGGKELDIQTDVYSFGVVLYELCTGVAPFVDPNPITVAYKQVHELPEVPSFHRKDIPKRLELIILKALKKDKKERYQNMESILQDLDTVEIKGETSLFSSITPSDVDHYDTANRRITDRRRGDRRKSPRRHEEHEAAPRFNFFSSDFWVYSFKQQWLVLMVVVLFILYTLVTR